MRTPRSGGSSPGEVDEDQHAGGTNQALAPNVGIANGCLGRVMVDGRPVDGPQGAH